MDEAAVLREVAIHERVGEIRPRHLRDGPAEQLRLHDVWCVHPHPEREERHVDDGRLARPLSLEQRGGHRAGDRLSTGEIAEGRGLRRTVGIIAVRECVHHA